MKMITILAEIIGSFDGIIDLNDGIIDQTVGIIDHINGIIDQADGIIGYIEGIIDHFFCYYQQNCSYIRQYGSIIPPKLVNISISMAGIKNENVLLKTIITRDDPPLDSSYTIILV